MKLYKETSETMDGKEVAESDDTPLSVAKLKRSYQQTDDAGTPSISGPEDYRRNVVTAIPPAPPGDNDVHPTSDAESPEHTEQTMTTVTEVAESGDIPLSVAMSKSSYQQTDDAGTPSISGPEDYQRNVVTAIPPDSPGDNDVHPTSDAQLPEHIEQTMTTDTEVAESGDIPLSVAKSKRSYQQTDEAEILSTAALNTRYDKPVEENAQELVSHYSQGPEDYQRNVVTAIPSDSPGDNGVHPTSDAESPEHIEQLQSDKHNYNLPKPQLRRWNSAWILMSLHLSLVYVIYNSEEVQTKSLEFLVNFMRTCPLKKGTILKFDLRDAPRTITEEEIAKKKEILDELFIQFLSHFSKLPFTSSIAFDNFEKLIIYLSSDSRGSRVSGNGGIGAYFIDENSNPNCVRYFNFNLRNYENQSNRIYKLHNNFYEVLAILVAIKVWAIYFQNKVVFIRSDSEFACRLIRNVPGTKWNKPCKDREFFFRQIAAISENFIIQPINIPREENRYADILAKGNPKNFEIKIREDGIKGDSDASDKEIIHHFLEEFDQAYERFHGSGN